jgi:hypothetical protein
VKVWLLAARPLARWIVIVLLAGALGCGRKGLRAGGDAAMSEDDGPIDGVATSADIDTRAADATSESTTDIDVCSSDVDCTPCLWAPAPTDPSQCPGYFNCCGGMSATKKRCEANHAAWNASCPGQSPLDRNCPCIALCTGDTAISCVEGRCIFTCPTTVDGG